MAPPLCERSVLSEAEVLPSPTADSGSAGDESRRPQLHDRVRRHSAPVVEGEAHAAHSMCCGTSGWDARWQWKSGPGLVVPLGRTASFAAETCCRLGWAFLQGCKMGDLQCPLQLLLRVNPAKRKESEHIVETVCPQLLAALDVADAALPSVKELQLPVRVLHLPVAFEDKWTKAYIQR